MISEHNNTSFPEQILWEKKRLSVVSAIEHKRAETEKELKSQAERERQSRKVLPLYKPVPKLEKKPAETREEKKREKRELTRVGRNNFIFNKAPERSVLLKQIYEWRPIKAVSADIGLGNIMIRSHIPFRMEVSIPIEYFSSSVGNIDLRDEKRFAGLLLEENRNELNKFKPLQGFFYEETPRVSMEHLPALTNRREIFDSKSLSEKVA